MLGRRWRMLTAVLTATAATGVTLAAPGAAQSDLPGPGLPQLGQAHRVAVLTGPGSINATDSRYNVHGTDLGTMWADDRGRVLAAFGDTFGPGGSDWRSNTLARSSDTELADGMTFDDFVTDRPGHAAELLPSLKIAGEELTTIPTGGVNVGGRDYLAYMSVQRFGAPGEWTTNFAGIAYSDDDGRTWVDVPGARRPNTPAFDDPFQMLNFVRRDGFVYAYGTPNGRFGDVRVARVPEDRLLDPAAYEYWTGPGGWRSGDPRSAVPIVQGPVGELSVQYNEGLRAWTMMYLDESHGTIAMRVGATAVGPWSPELVTANDEAYPALYGGFIHPASSGLDIYYTMTEYGTYNVSLMKVRLPFDVVSTVRNLLPPPARSAPGDPGGGVPGMPGA